MKAVYSLWRSSGALEPGFVVLAPGRLESDFRQWSELHDPFRSTLIDLSRNYVADVLLYETNRDVIALAECQTGYRSGLRSDGTVAEVTATQFDSWRRSFHGKPLKE